MTPHQSPFRDLCSVNAHTHLYSGLAPLGMPAPDPPPQNFLEILEKVWWRLDRALDAESLQASARLYIMEALLAGTTTLIDHHESPGLIEGSLDILADACQELGLRACLCYGATERNGGIDEARRGLAECERFIRENQRPLVKGVVGLHASFTVSDETLAAAGDLCRKLGTILHVHMAEDRADVIDAQRRGYEGPLERLLKLDALPPGSILAHGVHLNRHQVEITDRQGLWLVQNPRSNRGNRVGYPMALSGSTRVALGTDGYPARMSDEVTALEEESARAGEDPILLELRICAGDELVAELFHSAAAENDLIVFSEKQVENLTIAGRKVVSKGKLLSGDEKKIRQGAEKQARLLWERMQKV